MIRIDPEIAPNAIGMLQGKQSQFLGWIETVRFYVVDGKVWSWDMADQVCRCDDPILNAEFLDRLSPDHKLYAIRVDGITIPHRSIGMLKAMLAAQGALLRARDARVAEVLPIVFDRVGGLGEPLRTCRKVKVGGVTLQWDE